MRTIKELLILICNYFNWHWWEYSKYNSSTFKYCHRKCKITGREEYDELPAHQKNYWKDIKYKI